MSEPKSAYERVKAQHEHIIEITGANRPPLTYGQAFDDIAELLADYERLNTLIEWEYRYTQADSNLGNQMSPGSRLEEFGRDGWELCAVMPLSDGFYRWIFKRQKLNP